MLASINGYTGDRYFEANEIDTPSVIQGIPHFECLPQWLGAGPYEPASPGRSTTRPPNVDRTAVLILALLRGGYK